MKANEANQLKTGDVILVQMEVTGPTTPGTLAHTRGWINCRSISDTSLLGMQDLVVSCADAVTPSDLKKWRKKP